MEVEEAKLSSGYGKPPWIFKGSALYQFHLVKAEIARAIIPKDFRLVEAFGYTLGGFFLANYNESPVGTFDELVVIAGIVWNPPTSHAWAARVYVNNDEACMHGREEFGLPSRVATFSKSIKAMSRTKGNSNSFMTTTDSNMDIQVTEIDGHGATGLFGIGLTSPFLNMNSSTGMWPKIKMSLPSFSGRTEHKPQILKYNCQIECRVKPMIPAIISGLSTRKRFSKTQNEEPNESSEKRDMSLSVMLSKPLLAIEFNCLKMQVEPPVAVSLGSYRSSEHRF